MFNNQSIYGTRSTELTGNPIPTIPTPHVMHIYQQSPYINASLPVMPQHAGLNTSNQETMVEYELQYYTFPQEPTPVFGDGAHFQLTFEITYKTEEPNWSEPWPIDPAKVARPAEDWLGGSNVITLRIPSNAITGTINSAEIAQYVHQQLQARAVLRLYEKSKSFVEEGFDQQEQIFFQYYSNFYFNDVLQKYVVQMMPPSTNLKHTLTIAELAINIENCQVLDFKFYLRVPLDQPQAKLIANVLGVDTSLPISSEAGYDVYRSLMTSVTTLPDYPHFFGRPDGSTVGIFYNNWLLKANSDYQSHTVMSSFAVEYVGTKIPKIYNEDFVYVRSSASTPGVLIQDGQRIQSNILAIIPRSVGYGRLITLKNMFFEGGVSMPETLQSMYTLRLVLTDKEGNPLTFNAPFQLGILVKPHRPPLTAVDIAKESKGR